MPNAKNILLAIIIIGAVSVLSFRMNHRAMLSTTVHNEVAVCKPSTIVQNVSTANVIVAGTVTLVIPYQGDLARVVIQPEHVYKGGITAPTYSVLAHDAGMGGTSRPSTDLHFVSGSQEYLFFLHQTSGELYTTSQCDGTRVLGNGLTDEETAALPAEKST